MAYICDALPDLLSGSAVLGMLKRLEDKGFVGRDESERGYLYSPTQSDAQASKNALNNVVKTFFNGSPTVAATALLGMSDRIEEAELDDLEEMIAKARKAKGA